MKTAMNEMLEWVRATLPMDLDWPRMIEDKAESLLEKEKEQIKNAFFMGRDEVTTKFLNNGEEYYNGTYNQNK